ncbi:uncharacterized protein SPSK_00923 [Sporothrix schenckii 1099-18]|uniref:Uncharacterized protein n=1 Tax=Sporothrix schenckii 1099-18 TaxID=1397361 RepID=A0A0F2LWM3_SPOSC|nr:uncharacterized protein SPSK_00923 [Sporothrix schenckii 1099-18]KJR81872.1 hypothetical protein SPSK_00923 [Sporothrix schenckii 1099-18]
MAAHGLSLHKTARPVAGWKRLGHRSPRRRMASTSRSSHLVAGLAYETAPAAEFRAFSQKATRCMLYARGNSSSCFATPMIHADVGSSSSGLLHQHPVVGGLATLKMFFVAVCGDSCQCVDSLGLFAHAGKSMRCNSEKDGMFSAFCKTGK